MGIEGRLALAGSWVWRDGESDVEGSSLKMSNRCGCQGYKACCSNGEHIALQGKEILEKHVCVRVCVHVCARVCVVTYVCVCMCV